jgi:hypothetical protein
MKIKITTLAGVLAIGAALIQPGQATAQSEKPNTVVSLNELKSQLARVQDHIATTVSWLEQVKKTSKDPAALKKAATEYSNQFRALDAEVEKTRTMAVHVKARSNEHFESWQKDLSTVQNSKIREKAQERFTEAKEEFSKIIEQASEAKEQVLPFVSELKDIMIYLETDLSDEAVHSLSNTIWKLANRSKSVIGSIQDVNEQIDRTIKELPQK